MYTSASGRIVWALDNEQNVYVREGIFPDFRQGVDWLLGECFELPSSAILIPKNGLRVGYLS